MTSSASNSASKRSRNPPLNLTAGPCFGTGRETVRAGRMLLLSVVVVPETTESGTGIRAWGGRAAPLSALPGLPPGSASRSIRDLSAQAPSSSVVLQVVVPTCCLDECLNLRSEKAQPGIAVDGTLSVLQLAVADRLDDLLLSESELGACRLVAQGGILTPPTQLATSVSRCR